MNDQITDATITTLVANANTKELTALIDVTVRYAITTAVPLYTKRGMNNKMNKSVNTLPRRVEKTRVNTLEVTINEAMWHAITKEHGPIAPEQIQCMGSYRIVRL